MVACPRCEKHVTPDPNGACPACGGAMTHGGILVAQVVDEPGQVRAAPPVRSSSGASPNPLLAAGSGSFASTGVHGGAAQLGVWRSGRLLVMSKGAALPDRCVKTNLPAHGKRLKRSLSWHESWLFVLVLAGILIYVVAAILMSKRATIYLGLTDPWFAKRRRAMLIGWLGVLIGIGLTVFGFTQLQPYSGNDRAAGFIVSGLALAFITAIYGLVAARLVTPTRIDDHFVWLRGVCPEYLNELPEWPYGRK